MRRDFSQRAHDTIFRCRINAAFRSQVERRIFAAEGAPEEICPAPFRNAPKIRKKAIWKGVLDVCKPP